MNSASCLFLVHRHRKQGNIGIFEKLTRYAFPQQIVEETVFMGANHQEIGIQFLGFFQYGFHGGPWDKEGFLLYLFPEKGITDGLQVLMFLTEFLFSGILEQL